MPAYLIGGVDVSDPSWLEEYGPKVEALVEKHGGKYWCAEGRRMSRKEKGHHQE